ncbi:GNAT family N-acetyltransferase [Fulvivirgaceae bacterium PWU4]|uniref:GNAT family N-acetyltransferase n=1 Tax=Chryseosolibacter histidini TaxID=2782349 RepID=A0AAP2DHT9_9BACT|nr:GNAT family N-acetyltransferase [Chryseosolibacter histidini]MBT1696663.1 GNAT family N-acetyltransferase [Chryseosolibacter histidini]
MTETSVTIRNFQPTDLNSLTGLTNELGYVTTIEQMKARMETILLLPDYWTFVAVVNNKVVGYVGVNKNYFWEQDGCFIRIQALVVSQQHRRLGIAQKLVETVEMLARQLGARLIILNCGNREERRQAHQFYPKMGFEPKSTGYVKRLIND